MEFRRSRNWRGGWRRSRERRGDAIREAGQGTDDGLIPEESIRVFHPARPGLPYRPAHAPRPLTSSEATQITRTDLIPIPARGSSTADDQSPPQEPAKEQEPEPDDHPRRATGTTPIAIVALACRFPDADDLASFFHTIATGRRAFRRIPPGRLDLADYYSSDPATPDATYSTRAALVEGWRFDRATFGISQATYASCDPAQWLALETAARALASAGFASGAGLPAERTAAFIGNSLAGDVSRTTSLRLRWPYARRVLTDALFSAGARADLAEKVLAEAAVRYLAPFPPVTAETLAGSSPGTIAATVCGQFGFQGGGFTIDAGGASSLAAVTSACQALAGGELDVALAGGVAVSLDPLSLVGLAKLGVLATGDMRIYDASPTGFLPGEGCGMVLLMRSSDAAAAGLPIFAEILGWGVASAGQQRRADGDPGPMLLAMRKAYHHARIDPAAIAYLEGCGTGVAQVDEAELTALATLRAEARYPAVLGAATASIGHTGAAAGAAGLIKTVLAAANGILPPATGVGTPHQILSQGPARLRTPAEAERWPDDDVRRAAVSARSADGLSVHLVLASRPDQQAPGELPPDRRRDAGQGRARARSAPVPRGLGHPCAFFLQACDRATLTALLARIADVAAWLSDAELRDLACQLAIEAADRGTARVAIIATRQEQLARLASEAITMLPRLTPGMVSTRPGIFAADTADGQVTMLLAGQPAADSAPGDPATGNQEPPASHLNRTFAILRLLDELGVQPAAAVGHGLGQLAGLVWAGCASPADAVALSELRASALTAPPATAPGSLRHAIDQFAVFSFQPPGRRLISGCTGTELVSAAEVPSLLSAELLDARSSVAEAGAGTAGSAAAERLARAVRVSAAGASLLLQTGGDRALTRAIGQLNTGAGPTGQRRKVPVVTIDKDPSDDRHFARAAAALFAVGALTRPELLYAGRPARPIDLWQEQVFITNPCQTRKDHQPKSYVQLSAAEFSAAPPSTESPEPAEPKTRRETGAEAVREPDTSPVASVTAPPVTSQEAVPEPVPVPDPDPDPDPEPDAEPAHRSVAGVSTWVRGYAELIQVPSEPVPVPDDGPWEVITGGCEFLRPKIEDLFRHEPGAGRTLAVLGELPAAGTLPAALLAARSAVGSGRLVAISPDPGLAGFLACLHAEHPETGVTAVRAPLTPEGLEAASRIGAVAGRYLELVIAPDGTALEPVMAPVQAARGGGFPLGADDVVLISRGAGAAGLALAQVLACSGTAIAVVGRDHPRRDDAIIAALEQLRLAGAAVGYEIVNPASPAALGAALRRIEQRFGRVTGVAQAVAAAAPRRLAELTQAEVQAYAHDQGRVLDQLATAVRALDAGERGAGRLKLIATFGSVAERYGIPGGAMVALASGVLAGYGQRLAAISPGCLALHADWPAWSGTGLGERPEWADVLREAGYAPVSAEAGSRQLLKLMSGGERPARLAIHGRAGWPPPRPVALAGPAPDDLPGRFTGQVLLHYPGVELVTQVTISSLTDPYLGDYLIDGVALLPPTVAVEAMAQVASALAGAPTLTAGEVTMAAPVVLAGAQAPAVLRICALRTDDTVAVIVRCDSTAFAVDHFRATFSLEPAGGKELEFPNVSPSAARDDEPGPAVIGASEVYGTVCFQAGRFRRITSVELAGSREAVALAEGSDSEPWFEGRDAAELVLGSAAVTDAALQVVQLCVPHRRLMFAGWERAGFSGLPVDGPVTIRAVEVTAGGLVPRPRPGEGETTWDVEVVDQAGQRVASVRQLRMRDAGPLPRSEAWPVPLAACLLERGAGELGLGPALEVRISRAGDSGGVEFAVRAEGAAAACASRTAGTGGAGGTSAQWLAVVSEERLPGTDADGRLALAEAIGACASAGPDADVAVEVRAVAGADWLLVGLGGARIAGTVLDLAGIGRPVAVAIRTGTVAVPGRRSRPRREAQPAGR